MCTIFKGKVVIGKDRRYFKARNETTRSNAI